jgi:hypothetical protein
MVGSTGDRRFKLPSGRLNFRSDRPEFDAPSAREFTGADGPRYFRADGPPA